jgi:hypothetical protein
LLSPVQLSPLGPPSPACATPEHPSPTVAPVIVSTPPTPRMSLPPMGPVAGGTPCYWTVSSTSVARSLRVFSGP